MKLDFLHPIESFGIRQVSMSGIRVEPLEVRVTPSVPFPHRHDFWQIILITKGAGIHQIDFETYKVRPRQIFIIKPGQVHRWKMNANIKGMIVEFGRTGQLLNSPDEIILAEKEFTTLQMLTSIMQNEASARGTDVDASLRSLLNSFLIQLERHTPRQDSKKSTSVIENFRMLVEKNFMKEHRVEFYAEKMGITSKALTMQVTRALGKSPRTVIQDRFMMEARRYLAFSNMSIAEIGYELGFEDANYFTRFFKSYEKLTPAAFRKKHITD
jgi:AraC family transcriptional activator of pobA